MFRRSARVRFCASAAGAALALAAVLAGSAFGPAAPARAGAQAGGTKDPAARLQVIVKQVYVASDRDTFGGGEMGLDIVLLRCEDTPDACLPQGIGPQLTYATKSFGASSDETVTLNLVLPRAGDRVFSGYDASEQSGFPVYDGERYSLRFEMSDDDPSGFDFMGRASLAIFVEADWQVGSHSLWAQKLDEGVRGDYRIDFEIRRMPLPDLHPKAIRVIDQADSTEDVVCLDVENRGQTASAEFQMTLRAGGVVQRNGALNEAGLAVGQSRETCIRTNLPTSGRHQLTLSLDEPRAVPEMDELNNGVRVLLDRTPLGGVSQPFGQGVISTDPGSGSTPPTPTPTQMPVATATPTPAQSQADLTVREIRVRGKVPDGKDDCKDGKNDVTVVVKNGGTADAGSFVVRLVVDDDQGDAEEESVGGLDAGKEREVKFDDVRLKKGQRTLTATADAKNTVTESKEDNNTLKVMASCKDDD